MKKLDFLNIILLILYIFPNLRIFFKYSPFSPTALIILYSIIIYSIIIFSQVNSIKSYVGKGLRCYWYILFLVTVVTLIISQVYPIADNLKIQLRGSDQDNCVIDTVNQILNFSFPYTVRSYYGNPCSPLTGILFLYLPFVYLNLYYLGAIVFAVLTILSIKKYTNSIYSAAFFTSLLFGSIFNMEMLVVGSDLFLVGCGFVIIALSTVEAINTRNLRAIFVIAILTGLLSSARINFLVLAPVMSCLIFIHWKTGAVYFGFISFCIAIIPSGYLFYLNPEGFTPIHLLEKSNILLQGGFREIGAILSILSFFIGIYITRKSIKNIPFSIFISFLPMLLTLSLGDLINLREGQLSTWEGANYLLPIIPLALAVITIRLGSKKY